MFYSHLPFYYIGTRRDSMYIWIDNCFLYFFSNHQLLRWARKNRFYTGLCYWALTRTLFFYGTTELVYIFIFPIRSLLYSVNTNLCSFKYLFFFISKIFKLLSKFLEILSLVILPPWKQFSFVPIAFLAIYFVKHFDPFR